MDGAKGEPTIEELLSDPVMAVVLRHSRTTRGEVRALLRNTRERLARAKAEDCRRTAKDPIDQDKVARDTSDAAELRATVRQLLDRIGTTADSGLKRKLSEHAFELAQRAEQIASRKPV